MRDDLFQPTNVGKLDLKNHFVFAPIPSGFVEKQEIKKDIIDFYSERTKDVGLTIIGAININYKGSTNHDKIPYLRTQKDKRIWKQVVKKIHENGSKAMIEAWHSGSSRFFSNFKNYDVLTPSGQIGHKKIGRGLSVEMIEEIIGEFEKIALEAKKIGFDGIDLHAAHGSLLHDFLCENTNWRNDEYGMKTLFINKVVNGIKEVCGMNFMVGVRISNYKMYDMDYYLAKDANDLSALIQELSLDNIDFFDCSTVNYMDLAYPNSRVTFSRFVKEITKKPTICVGGIGINEAYNRELPSILSTMLHSPKKNNDKYGKEFNSFYDYDKLLNQYENGGFDLIGIGRPILFNPRWLSEAKLNLK
jgi:NADH:flavin oxidoreductases, Old Yellow Enzyme family